MLMLFMGMHVRVGVRHRSVTVPVRGEVVLAWGAPNVGESTELPGHSFALLATGQ